TGSRVFRSVAQEILRHGVLRLTSSISASRTSFNKPAPHFNPSSCTHIRKRPCIRSLGLPFRLRCGGGMQITPHATLRYSRLSHKLRMSLPPSQEPGANGRFEDWSFETPISSSLRGEVVSLDRSWC